MCNHILYLRAVLESSAGALAQIIEAGIRVIALPRCKILISIFSTFDFLHMLVYESQANFASFQHLDYLKVFHVSHKHKSKVF